MRRTLISAALLAVWSLGTMAEAATYYVDNLLPGRDSNNGTATITPFLTIHKCAAVMIAGDTCLVKNGTYTTQPAAAFNTSGTVSAPITLKNYPGHTPVINTGGALHGLTINADGDATHTVSYVTVEGLEITGAQYTGLKFGAADHLVIRHNYIHDNSLTPITEPGSGIEGVGKFITIDGNRVSHNGNTSIAAYGHGMYLIGTNYTVINNISDQNGGYGIQCAGYPFDPVKHPDSGYAGCAGLFANNTIAYNRNKPGMVLWNNGIAPIATVRNNIFYENGQLSSGDGQGIHIYSGVSATITNNVTYSTTPGMTGFIAAVDITNCSVACTISGNSLSTNPNLTNAPASVPASPDFHLSAGSVAIGFGFNLSSTFTTDYAGTTRTVPYDAGAYAFGDTTPPSAPGSLVATATSPTQINVSWTASTDDVGVTAYLVERCQGVGCAGFAQITSAPTTSLTDTGLTAATTYRYRVRATDAAGNLSAYSNIATATTFTVDLTAPSVPANLRLTATTQTGFDMAWDASTDNVAVTSYEVFRCTGNGCVPSAQVNVGGSSGTTFSNASLLCNTTYTYGVRASDAAGNHSALSTSLIATTLSCVAPPAPPTGVTLQAVSDFSRDTGSWSWSQGAGTAADGFHLKCGKVTTERTLLVDVPGTSTTSLFVRQFLPGQGTWFCTVVAYNAGGESTEATEATTNVIGPGFGAWGFAY